MQTRFINYTPHDIHVVISPEYTLTIPRTGIEARAQEQRIECPSLPPAGLEVPADETRDVAIPTYRTAFGAVTVGEPGSGGAPFPDPWEKPETGHPQEGTYYLVSLVTAQALAASGRRMHDILTPGEAVRDGQGRIVGCRALVRWF